MDFQKIIYDHRQSKAEVTMAVTPVRAERTAHLGIVKVDDSLCVREFIEKPQLEEERERFRTPANWLERQGLRSQGGEYLANMGIYVFNCLALHRLMTSYPQATDLVREILVPSLGSCSIRAHVFDGYWEDLGTIKSYHEAHLALAGDQPPFDFSSPEGVIYTRIRNLPASRVRAASVTQSLIADGCEIGAESVLDHSVIGVRSRIGSRVQLRQTVLLGADELETAAQKEENRRLQRPDIGVGDGSILHKAIVDRDCRIGRNVQIVNRRQVDNEEGDYHVIRDGIVVIPDGMIVPDGTVI